VTDPTTPETPTTTTTTTSDPLDAATIMGGDEHQDAAPAAEAEAKGAEGETKPDAPAPNPLHGAPEGEYALTLPEGMSGLDPDAMAAATPLLKELGLSNEGASKLLPVAQTLVERGAAQAQAALAQQVAAQSKAWADAFTADPELGGTRAAETQHLIATAIDKLGGASAGEFRQFLNDTRLGNHPVLGRILKEAGKLVSEDGTMPRSATQTVDPTSMYKDNPWGSAE
jgi:hypothetical protein